MSDQANSESNGSASHGPERPVMNVPASHPLAVHHGNGHQPRTETGQAITVSFVLNALRRWWKIATPIGILLAAVAGGAIWYSFEPMYEASAWLRIRPERLVFNLGGDQRSLVQTQIELMRSPLVLDRVIGDPEIAEMPEVVKKEEASRDWLQQQVKVKTVGQSDFVTLSFTGPDPANSAKIVNKLVGEYFNLRDEVEEGRKQKVVELLEKEREKRASEVNRLRDNVKVYAERDLGKDPWQPMVTTEPSPLQGLQSQLTTTEFEIELLKAQFQASGGLISDPNDEASDQPGDVVGQNTAQLDALIDRGLLQHPEVQALERALAADRARLREYGEKLRPPSDGSSNEVPNDPLYTELEEKIASNEKRLESLRGELRPDVEKTLKMAMESQRKGELAELEAKLESALLMKSLLTTNIETERAKVKEYSGQSFDLKCAEDDLGLAEEVFSLIATRVMQFRTERDAPSDVQLMREAAKPTKPLQSNPLKQLIMAVLGAFCLPFGLVVLWERVVRRVTGARQLREESQLPVVGEIARLPAGRRVLPGASARKKGHDLRVFEESIDSLRTCLALSESLKDVKVLAVTSAANNEGKTSVAVQLAVSCARASGELALLIDGDMRSPDIHRVLETRVQPGLAEVLAGDCTLEEAIITDWSKRVHILPAGKLRGTPHKLLGNGKLKSLLSELRPTYRHVIFDTPPILAAGEALVFAKEADASLICAMRDVSRLEQVNTAHERLVAAAGNPIGVVLNGVPTREYIQRYGSYEYYRTET